MELYVHTLQFFDPCYDSVDLFFLLSSYSPNYRLTFSSKYLSYFAQLSHFTAQHFCQRHCFHHFAMGHVMRLSVVCLYLQYLRLDVFLSCTVCDRKTWGLWKSQRIFQRHFTQRKRMCMPFEWIGTISTKYQPLGEDSDGKSPSFL